MKILISNDDGVHARGIHILSREIAQIGETTIVAPERERSTTGHSLTLHKPLRIHAYQEFIYSVSGGPSDCIYLGLHAVMKGKPDLVVSGINRGANLGQDVFYSGTVAAAREAANMGIPALAVSLCLDGHKKGEPEHFESAARAAREILQKILGLWGQGETKAGLKLWPSGLVVNVNVPNLPYEKLKGFRLGVQGHRIYGSKVLRRTDARGREYFWIGGDYQGHKKSIANSDCRLVEDGFVAITPLELDTTMMSAYNSLSPAFSEVKKRRTGLDKTQSP